MLFDERVFVDKSFEGKLLKNISDKVFKQLKELKKIKKQSCYIISEVSSDWIFSWILYSISTKVTYNWVIKSNVWFSVGKGYLKISFYYRTDKTTKEQFFEFGHYSEKDLEELKKNLILLKDEIKSIK